MAGSSENRDRDEEKVPVLWQWNRAAKRTQQKTMEEKKQKKQKHDDDEEREEQEKRVHGFFTCCQNEEWWKRKEYLQMNDSDKLFTGETVPYLLWNVVFFKTTLQEVIQSLEKIQMIQMKDSNDSNEKTGLNLWSCWPREGLSRSLNSAWWVSDN